MEVVSAQRGRPNVMAGGGEMTTVDTGFTVCRWRRGFTLFTAVNAGPREGLRSFSSAGSFYSNYIFFCFSRIIGGEQPNSDDAAAAAERWSKCFSNSPTNPPEPLLLLLLLPPTPASSSSRGRT